MALWLDARFPGIAPPDLRRALFRTFIAFGVAQLVFPPVWAAALARSPVLVALFSIASMTSLLLVSGDTLSQTSYGEASGTPDDANQHEDIAVGASRAPVVWST